MKNFNPKIESDKLLAYIRGWFDAASPDSKAIIGIGDKNSLFAVTLLINALGKDRVLGVIQTSFNTQLDISFCNYLGIEHIKIDRGSTEANILNRLHESIDFYSAEQFHQALENMDSRVDMLYLYTIKDMQKVPAFVVNDNNRSDFYIGNFIKYGNTIGDISIFQDITETEMQYIGDLFDITPTFTKTYNNIDYVFIDAYINYKEDKSITEEEFNILVSGDVAYAIKKEHKKALLQLKPMPSYINN